jgi:hypothetical protein
MSTNYFIEACGDYKYLRERGYPSKAALKIVGDHHMLSRVERNSIFRGIIPEQLAAARRKKIAGPREIAGGSLSIDWYNVLITVESYLRGLPVFIAEDGMLRDSSATHGSYRTTAVTTRALEKIFESLAVLSPSRVDIYLDAPIAFSGLMADEVRERLALIPCPSSVSLVHSADYPLKHSREIVATSDSVILDCVTRMCDLPRCVMERCFGFSPPALRDAFPESPTAPPRLSGSGTRAV